MQFGVSESTRHWGKYRPGSLAVYHNDRVITFRELDELVNIVSNKIENQGISDKRVGIAVRSKLHLLISIIGVLRANKSAVILNTGLPTDALGININDTKISALIFDQAQRRLAGLRRLRKRKLLDIEDAILEADSDAKRHHVGALRQPSDEWGIIFSSGTTGVPKGIERDQSSIITELLGWSIELQLNRDTIFYVGRPIHYAGGLVLSLASLLVGGAICISDLKNDDDPEEAWKDYQNVLRSHTLAWAFFVPDQIRSFVKIAEKTKTPPAGAQTILVMGAPISGEEKIKAAQILGSQIVESWGNSESLGTITEPNDLTTRPNSIGRPFLTDELCILNDGVSLAEPGEVGRIAGSDVAGFFRYSSRPQETDRVRRNGMIVSDDIGYMDKEGYFYICGRDQDCVLINGKTVFLSDVEKTLRTHAQISDCCVVAKPVKEGMLSLAGVIVCNPGATANEMVLLDELNRCLLPPVQLSQIILVNEIPRLPSGKQDKIKISNLVDTGP